VSPVKYEMGFYIPEDDILLRPFKCFIFIAIHGGINAGL
jgi:hypothetical protein